MRMLSYVYLTVFMSWPLRRFKKEFMTKNGGLLEIKTLSVSRTKKT